MNCEDCPYEEDCDNYDDIPEYCPIDIEANHIIDTYPGY